MSIKASHFRKMIIDALTTFNPELASPVAVELLMLTAAQETCLGEFLYQDNHQFGPALGFYQIEPATHKDIFEIYFNHKYPKFKRQPDIRLLDPVYATIICRGIYANRPEALPDISDIPGIARYYKKWFNTEKGSAETNEVIRNYKRYAL